MGVAVAEPLLSVRGVSKRFGALQALDGVSLDVQPGTFHGLIGPNGSGKSTLLKAIAGAHFPDGIAFALDPAKALRDDIGMATRGRSPIVEGGPDSQRRTGDARNLSNSLEVLTKSIRPSLPELRYLQSVFRFRAQ